jgi:hypothetical protein
MIATIVTPDCVLPGFVIKNSGGLSIPSAKNTSEVSGIFLSPYFFANETFFASNCCLVNLDEAHFLK